MNKPIKRILLVLLAVIIVIAGIGVVVSFPLLTMSPAETGAVDIALDFFEPEASGKYMRVSERFRERFFQREAILRALKAAGLEPVAEYGDDGYDPPKDTSERVIYVCKK